jgi:SsrA-binding protein
VSEVTVKNNKYAAFKYSLDKKYEAGIVLTGADVKAIRGNEFEVRDAIVREEKGELFIWNILFHKQKGTQHKRKLLLHKNEIAKILVMLKDKKIHGYVVAVKFNEQSRIKLEIGIGRIKKQLEKKTSEKRSTEKRTMEREMGRGNL